jgi:hypothetical protein
LEQLVLRWSCEGGWHDTPHYLQGKKGLYAVVYGGKIICIGKAVNNDSAVYKGAKLYEGKYAKYLRKIGIISEGSSSEEANDIVRKQGSIYVGVVSSASDLIQVPGYIGFAEALILNMIEPKPWCNDDAIPEYTGVRPFLVMNEGDRPPGLLEKYEIL